MPFLLMTKHNRTQKSAGFTLIEILIIAPIVVIAISGFVALMVSLVGKVLVARDQGAMTYDTQNALNRIEEDVRLSAKFFTTTGTLPTPQGSNNNFTGTSAFTNTSNTLILNALATDSNPRDSDRWLMYYDNQPNPCGSTETSNRVFSIRIIYFIKNGSLWRRTYVPDWNLNTSSPDANTICTYSSSYYPWQKNSCSPGYSASRCKAEDEKVMDNITALSVQYFSDPKSTTDIGAANAETATTINATITGSKTTAGNPITTSSSLRVTKLNSINTDASPLTAPVVSHSILNGDTAVFSWAGIPSATNYLISYNVNGGTWTNTTASGSTTSYAVSANRGDTVSIKVAATNGTYTSSYTADAATLPLWVDADFGSAGSGWVDYSSTFAHATYTRTSAGVVSLKGLVKNGTATWDTTMFTLPPGYRPDTRLIFYVGSYNAGASGFGRIDVLPSGEVRFMQGTSNWISLDSIKFLANGSWTDLTTQNGWVNYGPGYPNLGVASDSAGRAHLRGLVKNGPTSPITVIGGPLPANLQPPNQWILPGVTSGTAFASYDIKPTDVITRSAVTSYIATNAIYYPSSYGGWINLPLQGGWVVYSSTFNSPQYTKGSDGLVTVKGLIKNGTSTSNGTILAQLPPGYRPSEKLIFSSVANSHHARIDVASNGNITIEGSGDAVWMSLDQISFMAEQ